MRKVVVNLCRLLLAVVFTFSGFVKAVDPMGTQYKIDDYLEALHLGSLLPAPGALVLSVLLSALEFCLGLFLLFAIRRRFTSACMVVMLLVMTPLTLWLAVSNPVSDCGCFGDAVVLTNWQTFAKNVVLLLAALVVARWPLDMFRFVSESNQWIAVNYSVVFILGLSGLCLYDLPLFDFRPYHIGANIKEGMEMSEGAEQPEFETTFIMEKDGRQQEFGIDNYPDSTWTFVDSKTVMTKAGYVPPIHDFSVTTSEGDDITEQILDEPGYVFLLVAPHLEQADDSRLDLLNELYEYAREHNYPFYGLTASGERAIARWRDMTGAEYEFCQTDETTLKTIIRSNPGVLLLKQGTIIRKWSDNRLPVLEENETGLPLEQLEIGQMPSDTVPGKVTTILLWFVLPLALLSVADRIWMWSKWVRPRQRKALKKKNNKTT